MELNYFFNGVFMQDILREVFPIAIGLGLLIGFISNTIGLLINKIIMIIYRS